MAEPGPIRDRLATIGQRIDRGVDAVWSLTRQGAAAERAVELTDPASTADRLKDARRRLADAADDATRRELQDRVDALARSHAAAQRLCNSVEDLGPQVDVINARLAAAVAQAAELVVSGPAEATVDAIAADLDDALLQLEATRRALDEVDQL